MPHLPFLAGNPAGGTPCRASRQRPPRAPGQHRRTPQRHQPPTPAAGPQQGSPLGAAQTLPLQQWAPRGARNPTEDPWATAEPISFNGSPPPRSPHGRPHAWQAATTRPLAGDLHRARNTISAGRSQLPLGQRTLASQRPLPEPINRDGSPPPRSPARPAPNVGAPWSESMLSVRQRRRSEAQADTSLAAGRQWTPPRPAGMQSMPMAGPTAMRPQQAPAGAGLPAGSRAAAAGRRQAAGTGLSSPIAAAQSSPIEQIPAGGIMHDQAPAAPVVHLHHSPHLQPPPGLHQAPQHSRHSSALPGDRRRATPQQQFPSGLRPATQLSPQPPQMWPQTSSHLSDRAAPCLETQAQSGPKRPAPDSSSSERSSSDLLAEAGIKRARASPAPQSHVAGEFAVVPLRKF